MKNEEIIDEMMCQCCSSRKKCMKDAEERCSEYGDGLDLLNEKDRQFKEYLENQRKGLLEQIDKHKSRGHGYDGFEECYTYMAAKLLRIIEELFGETEQDNSDREE